jgi:hypothetical protein
LQSQHSCSRRILPSVCPSSFPQYRTLSALRPGYILLFAPFPPRNCKVSTPVRGGKGAKRRIYPGRKADRVLYCGKEDEVLQRNYSRIRGFMRSLEIERLRETYWIWCRRPLLNILLSSPCMLRIEFSKLKSDSAIVVPLNCAIE